MVVVSQHFSAPVEGILYQGATKLLVNDQELGNGTLYITENNIVFGGGVTPSGSPVSTISMLYPTMSMHGVQREPYNAFVMMVNYDLRLPELSSQSGGGDTNETDEDDEFDPDDQPTTRLAFIPANESDIQQMCDAVTHGQTLHPDPADEVDEDPYMDGEEFIDGEEEFEDAEESNAAPEDAAARMRQMRLENGCGQDDDEVLEDAEIGEE